MKIAVLSHSAELYSTRRLLEAARALGHDAWQLDPIRVVIHAGGSVIPRGAGAAAALSDDGVPVPLPQVVIPRVGSKLTQWGLNLLRTLRVAGVHAPVTAEALALAQDKLATTLRCAAAGLPTVPTVAAREPAHIADALDAAPGPPWIIKLPGGTQGVGVTLALDRATARAILDALMGLGQTALVQPAWGHERARDLRVLVLDGRAHAAAWRYAAPGEFRSNVHRGGRTEAVAPGDLPAGAARLAEGAARALNLPICGVDLLEHDARVGGPLAVLEVNGSPGLAGIEAATGEELARAVVLVSLPPSRRP